jgi:[ribosomal protein S5]-alanine N-acetyltransferase
MIPESEKTSHLIEGTNIYLREVSLSDVCETYLNWLNDNEVNQFLETRFCEQSLGVIKKYVEDVLKAPDFVFFVIIVKEGQIHIGNIKIGPINKNHGFADVSLFLGDKKRWRQGYGSEAIKLVVRYAFEELNLHRLNAGVYANNIGSIKAFLKSGFKEEGTLKDMRLSNGVYVDEKLFGIVNKNK